MDATDVRILRALRMKPFEGLPAARQASRPVAIADALGLSVRTVKDRIAQLEADGVIAGYEAYPNLRHLGLRWTTFHYRVDEARKRQATRDLAAIDGVAATIDFLGPDLCVDLYYRDEPDLARKLRLVSTLTGGAKALEFYRREMPPVARALDTTDWRIVRALRGDARRPLADVAEELGLSARTVKNRFDRMTEEMSLDVVPRVDPGRMGGVIPFGLACYTEDGLAAQAWKEAERQLGDHCVSAWQPPEPEAGTIDFSLFARSLAEVQALRARVAAIPGVTRAETLLPCGAWENTGWLDEAIDRRLREATAGSASGSLAS